MSEPKYYKCSVCGNIIEKVHDSGLVPMCCMREMMELVPENNDDLAESHKPVPEKHKRKYVVYVGENIHPMDEMHYIEWVEIVTDQGTHRKYLHPGDEPVVCFHIGKKENLLELYAYCNRHGLWKNTYLQPQTAEELAGHEGTASCKETVGCKKMAGHEEIEYDRYTDD